MDPYSSMYGVHLDMSLVPNAGAPFKTSPVPGFTSDYDDASLAWDGTNLVGALSHIDGTMNLKTFPREMTHFNSAVQRTGKIGEPSAARAGTQWISTWFSGATLELTKLMANGETDSIYRMAGATSSTIVATSAASGDVVVVAAALAGGSCFLHAITSAATATGAALAGPCARPHVVGAGTSFTLAYETSSSSFEVRAITATTGTTPVGGAVLLSGAGRSPRLFDVRGERLVAFIDGSSLGVRRVSDSASLAVSGLPSGAPDAFEVASAYIFATYGTTLYVVTPD